MNTEKTVQQQCNHTCCDSVLFHCELFDFCTVTSLIYVEVSGCADTSGVVGTSRPSGQLRLFWEIGLSQGFSE